MAFQEKIYLFKGYKILYNKIQVQSYISNKCGLWYYMLYIILIIPIKDIKQFIHYLHQIVKIMKKL